jgi:hypothetical protein
VKNFAKWVCAFSLLFLCACSIKIGRLNPEPTIPVGVDGSIFLVISDDIKDSFNVKSEAMKTMVVKDWRASLEAGFRNGFAGRQSVASSRERAEYIIEIEKAAPKHQLIDHGQMLCITKITYEAKLKDLEGNVLKSSSHTIYSKDTPYRVWDFNNSLEDTIEAMYLTMTTELFGR